MRRRSDLKTSSGMCRTATLQAAAATIQCSPVADPEVVVPLIRGSTESHQREMAKRLHGPPFHQAIPGALGPGFEPCKREFQSPTEMANQGGKAAFTNVPQPGLGAKVVDQYDLASRLDHTGELVERRLRIRHCRDHELRHHHVEK